MNARGGRVFRESAWRGQRGAPWSGVRGLSAGGDEHNSLAGAQGILERLVNVFEGVFRRNIAQRSARLDEVPEVVQRLHKTFFSELDAEIFA